MADWTIVAENVRAPTGAPVLTGIAVQNIGPGNAVWQVNSTHVDLANATNVNAARVAGITVDLAYTGQPITYVAVGTMALGNDALAIGHAICLSNVAGKLCNIADVPATNYMTKVGWGNNATTASLSIEVTGLQKA